jgi:uncharacterized iron-regulated membrane protein
MFSKFKNWLYSINAVKVMRWSRELHKWTGLAMSLVFLLIAVTGIMLLFKEEWGFQPKTERGEEAEVNQYMSIDELLSATYAKDYEGLKSLKDVNRIDMRPNRNVAKIRSNDELEIQIEMTTGNVLSVGYRHDKLLEDIHDGSFFGDWFKYIIVTASGVILIFLCFSAYYIWGFSLMKKMQSKKRKRKKLLQSEEHSG